MIAIINYEAGNLASVSNALTRLGADFAVTNKQDELEEAQAVILPGVGHARPAMQALQKRGLDTWLRSTNKPLMGICLGMQLLFDSSEEGDTEGLGLIPGRLRKFESASQKVPHMGWNTFSKVKEHPLLKGLDVSSYFYYVHSYFAPENESTLASCHYITDFAAVVGKGNVVGTQFHPEKSGEAGARLLQNFLNMAASGGWNADAAD
jgi:glutamine amidotransferase